MLDALLAVPGRLYVVATLLPLAAFVILLLWVSTYPIMLRQMDRQYLRERSPVTRSGRHRRSRTVTRLAVVWAWMVLLGGIAAYLAGGLLVT